jgi:hypothetical protein
VAICIKLLGVQEGLRAFRIDYINHWIIKINNKCGNSKMETMGYAWDFKRTLKRRSYHGKENT